MNKEGNFFIKINYSVSDKNTKSKSLGAYITKIDKEDSCKYMIGGGCLNKNKGSFIFKVKDLEEANQIAKNNAFIKDKVYSYELIILDKKIKIA